MSVTDPLLKKLKGHIKNLRLDPNPIRDQHQDLQPLCETIECIFRKGFKQPPVVFLKNRKDYWTWIEQLTLNSNSNERINPIFSMVVSEVKGSKKVFSMHGFGRLFIRTALQKKVLSVPIEHLIRNVILLDAWYEPDTSIFGNEILCEILMSALFEATEINFELDLKNASFLDETWTMPIFKSFEFVPCKQLGIEMQHLEGRAIVVSVDPGSVAEEDRKIEIGDILDELAGQPLKNINRGKIPTIFRKNLGQPVQIAVVKCLLPDKSVFKPTGEIIKKLGTDFHALQKVLHDEEARARARSRRVPPHALLSEDEADEHPVHNADCRASYQMLYLGKKILGNDGGVHVIEATIGDLVKIFETDTSIAKPVTFELGETDVTVVDDSTKEVIYNHSYTEISSCGRRVDFVSFFAYIAGETTCTLARNFVGYVFKAKYEDESKQILCSIAQGFQRTHWYV